MTCVGTELGGKVEVATTPGGHIKRVRVHPDFEDMPAADRERVIMSAYVKAARQGRTVMQAAEERVYAQFLRDIKPLVLGIRDNPEFYTVSPDAVELPGGVLATPDAKDVHRTIPYRKARGPAQVAAARQAADDEFLQSRDGRGWLLTAQGKRYAARHMPELRPAGAPGAKKRVTPFELPVPYTPMDERALLRRNWMAYLDNKHVAESLWTRVRMGDRMKEQRQLQKTGHAWHAPVSNLERY
jgi:hypothetical protein